MERHVKAFKAVSVITLFSIFNLFLTVFLQIILAAVFGAKIEMDAYLLAIAIPVVTIALFTSASEVVFVPFLKEMQLTDSKSNLAKIESTIFDFLFLILLVVSVLAVALAPKIVQYLAPGFSAPAKELVVTLFRIITPSIVFAGLSGFMISIYHSEERFTRAALVNIVNSSVLIVTFFLLYPLIKIKALALGMLLGSIGQFLLLSPILFRIKSHLFSLDLRNPKLSKAGKRFLQILIGGAFIALIIPFERLFASKLPEGSISYLGYAGRIISIFLLLPATAIPIVLLPNLSRHFTMQNFDKLRHNLALGIRFVLFIVFPIIVLLVIFRTDLVYILLERGSFNRVATDGVASVDVKVTSLCRRAPPEPDKLFRSKSSLCGVPPF